MLGRSTFVAQRRIGIGQVDHDAFDQRSEGRHHRALAGGLHVGQHVGSQLQVPGIVELAGFKYRAASRSRVAAALEGHLSECRLRRIAVVRIGFQRDNVIRPEIGDREWSGPDRSEIGPCAFRCLGAQTIGELRGLNQWRLRTDKRAIGKRFGNTERHFDGTVIQCLDTGDVVVFFTLGTAAFRMRAVFPGEDGIGSGHGAAIGPFQALFQLPGDCRQVGRNAAIFHGRNGFDQPGHHVTALVVARQRLKHQRCGFQFLGAAGKIWVHRRGRLPVDDVDLTVGSPLGQSGWGNRHRGDGAQQSCSNSHSYLHMDVYGYFEVPAVGSAVCVLVASN